MSGGENDLWNIEAVKLGGFFIYYKIFISPKHCIHNSTFCSQFIYKIKLLPKIICEILEIHSIHVKGHKWVKFSYLIGKFQTWEQLKSDQYANCKYQR